MRKKLNWRKKLESSDNPEQYEEIIRPPGCNHWIKHRIAGAGADGRNFNRTPQTARNLTFQTL